jgi:Methylamine utilisation protein MauE
MSAESSTGGQARSGWPFVGAAGALVLGAVLLVAAAAKALDPSAFAEQIRREGLDLLLPAGAVALVALALEAGLGTALLLGVRRLWVLVPSALLVGFFLTLTGRDWWLTTRGLRDPSAACGCFGNLLERTPAEALRMDLLLLALPLALAFLGRRTGRRFPPARTAAAAIAALAVAVFAWQAPALPLDDLATRLRPGKEVAELCTGDGDGRVCLATVVPELARGRHLVVLADLEDPAFTGAVDRLNAYARQARDGGVPDLWVVDGGTPEQQRLFFWQWGPAFEVREAPAALLRPLYRSLPRSFLVEDGTVRATYSGMPPLARFTAGGSPASTSAS